tara:strand:- start:1556 stop:2122 length:567 start_codon:yes stop_codon:yes gene_type:complete
MNFLKIIKPFLIFFSIATILSGCGKIPKPDWGKPIEPNARKRSEQNVKDGKGIQIFRSKNSGGMFEFASSNPMWKASLETLSFMSLANSDYSGGVLITDWYSEDNPDEAIKITIRFLSNEIRADGLIVNLYKRNCIKNACTTREIKNDLIFEIKDKILKKAAIYKKQNDTRQFKNRPKKVYRDKDSKN